MKLSVASHDELETFFRDYLGDGTLILPSIYLHSNPLIDWLTRLCQVGAITFGRHVIVSPALIERDRNNRPTLPGWLLAHEAMHVLQYAQLGCVRFLSSYVRQYFQALREAGRWDAAARMTAYLVIPEEQEARRAENAFLRWQARRSINEHSTEGQLTSA